MIQLEKDLYTLDELSILLNRSLTALYNNIYSKKSRFRLKVVKKKGRILVKKSEVQRYIDFLEERDGLVEVTSEYALNKITTEIVDKPDLEETKILFLGYARINFNKMSGSNAYKKAAIGQYINFYNKLIQVLINEVFHLDTDTINELFLREKFLNVKEKLLFSRFVTYAFDQKKLPLKTKLLAVQKNKRSEQEIYSVETFNQIYKHVQNIDVHLRESISSRKYANMWVYVTLLCCDFIRGSDLILNTPILNLRDLDIQGTDFETGSITLTDVQIQSIMKHVYLSFRNKRASKTGEILTFLIPSNIEKPLAYALVVSEYLRKNDQIQLGTFIEGKYQKIRTHGFALHLKFFEYYDEFEGFRFSSLIMNRTIATYLYGAVTEGEAYDSELALILTQKARSHKSEESTKRYIQMMSTDGSLERVSNNLFRRGHFGWLYDQLLRFVVTDKNQARDLETRTLEIEKVKDVFTLKDIEALAAYSNAYLKPYVSFQDKSIEDVINSIYEKRVKVIHKIMQLNKFELKSLLKQLSTHSLPSKNENAQCLIAPNCEYPALMNCMYCEYVLPQNLILIQLNQELLRLLELIKSTRNPNVLKRENRFLIQCLLILSEANNTFGNDYVSAYVEKNKLKLLLEETAHKLDI